MERLELKQRECIQYESDINNYPFKKKNKNQKKDIKNGNDCGIKKKSRNELLQQLANLHLRKTEILRDCVKKNAYRGVLFPNLKVRAYISI